MKFIRKVLVGALLAGGALLTVATNLSVANAVASAADDAVAGTPSFRTHDRGPHGGDPHEFGPEHIFGKLGLTPEQQASIKSLMAAARPQMKSFHDQMQANHLKLMQTRPDDPNYGSVVAEVAQENAALASQRTTQGAELRTQMYAVLTPAQKSQLATLEAQWMAHPHHARWGGPHEGGVHEGGAHEGGVDAPPGAQ
ncbi:MAG: Spy/CpxP family protein refolding chaperone [Pseudomonadota bacterium]|nr:Spy/CpxP family protein refolding chaperone [Pseudomonadota bacterium]